MLSIHQRLRRIGSTIADLNERCDRMQQHVAAARHETAPILEDVSTLLVQRQELHTKTELLRAFNKHFLVPEDELKIFTTNADTVNDDFFRVLTRVKQIHKDCQLLLGAENQRLGLELMESSSRHLNTAYQKLYRWILREFKTINFENPQISPIIRRALKALAERPTLFQSCLDFFAEARENVLLDAFNVALTGPSGDSLDDQATKPIEFHAHDPPRYIGDMLAWTHSATVSEREALESLAATDGDEIMKGIQAGTENEPWTVVDGETFDGRKALKQLAGRNLDGVLRVLRQRVDQSIHSQEDPVLIYKIANLLEFYNVTFVELLGSDCKAAETLSWLESSALKRFQSIMEEHTSAIQIDVHRLPSDLHVPDYLADALLRLQALMRSFDSSLTTALSREEDFRHIVSLTLDPFLELCKRQASSVLEPAHSVFLTNCLNATKTALSNFGFVENKRLQIVDDLSKSTTALVEYQHAYFLHDSGLHPLLAALAALSDDVSQGLSTIAGLPALQPPALRQASQTLDDFLPSALMNATDNLRDLSDKQLSGEITAAAAERFCADFEFVEGRLAALDEVFESREEFNHDANDQEKDRVRLRTMFPRTTGEIHVLLS